MKYYEQLPTVTYEFEGREYTIKNIFLKIGFINLIKENSPDFFNKYFIEDGERPESIAYKYYGNQDLWWLIILLNEIKDPFFDWCLSIDELEEWSKIEAQRRSPTDVYDEVERVRILSDMKTENEKKREIYLLKPQFVNTLLIELIKNSEN